MTLHSNSNTNSSPVRESVLEGSGFSSPGEENRETTGYKRVKCLFEVDVNAVLHLLTVILTNLADAIQFGVYIYISNTTQVLKYMEVMLRVSNASEYYSVAPLSNIHTHYVGTSGAISLLNHIVNSTYCSRLRGGKWFSLSLKTTGAVLKSPLQNTKIMTFCLISVVVKSVDKCHMCCTLVSHIA